MVDLHKRHVEHSFACALHCLGNAVVAMNDSAISNRRRSAALWVHRATDCLRGSPRADLLSPADRACLAAAHAVAEDALHMLRGLDEE